MGCIEHEVGSGACGDIWRFREEQEQAHCIRNVVRSNERVVNVASVEAAAFVRVSSLVGEMHGPGARDEKLRMAPPESKGELMVEMDAVFERESLDGGGDLVGVGG
jgi:hypothetical protein